MIATPSLTAPHATLNETDIVSNVEATLPKYSINTLVAFPVGTFFENLAVRADNSMLVTLHENKQLYFVPSGANPTPILLKTFKHCTLGIVQLNEDEFFISTSDPAIPNSSSVWRLDFEGYILGQEVALAKVVDLPEAKWLNGSCAIGQHRVLLLADSVAACIWRVDVDTKDVSKWLADDETMRNTWPAPYDAAPGINGIHYNPENNKIYYTSTVPGMFCSIDVHSTTLEASGSIEIVAEDVPGADDFTLDLVRKGAWIATHTSNSIDFVGFDGEKYTLAGGFGPPAFQGELVPDLCGTTAVAWSRAKGEEGRVLFVTTEGGISFPPDGVVREGKILRIELF